MKMGTLVVGACVVACGVAARPALAQLSFGTPEFVRSTSGSGVPGPAAVAEADVMITDLEAGQVATVDFRDDFTTIVQRGVCFTQSTMSVRLTIGSLPVRLSAPNVRLGGKLVNSGGAVFDSHLNSTVSFGYKFRDGGGSLLAFRSDPATALAGQGLVEFQTPFSSSPFSYIMTPGEQYTLEFNIEVLTSNTATDSLIRAVTLEAGAISNYEGLTAVFTYETVPAPGGAALLAGAA
ncbi:MAG: hypothetical protein SFZ24_04465, partial [Planctomycetota bacterium]|nr:hypothetical protein [Planctomycetota bacterium]